MGFTARESFKVIHGVRVTVSKSGVPASPGTWCTTSARPGLTAPRWEKQLHAALLEGDLLGMATVAQTAPDAAVPASLAEGVLAYERGAHDRAREVLAWVWAHGGTVENNAFVRKYLSASAIEVGVADGVRATLPISRDAVGLSLAELHQRAGDVDQAIRVVEQLDPSMIAAVSLVELYNQVGRHEDVIEMTNGLRNDDDASALLLTLRGVAFREKEAFTAARESFKEALKSTKRDADIRHLAFLERARTYLAEGKKAMARRDLERIMAGDANYPGLSSELERAS